MPAPQEPQQQAPMEMTSDSAPGVVTQQPDGTKRALVANTFIGNRPLSPSQTCLSVAVRKLGVRFAVDFAHARRAAARDVIEPTPRPNALSLDLQTSHPAIHPPPILFHREGGQRSSPIPIPNPRRWSITEDRPNEVSFPSNVPVPGSNFRPGDNSRASRFAESFDVDEGSTSTAGEKSSGKGKAKAKDHPLLHLRWADMDVKGKAKDKQEYEEDNEAVYDEDDEVVYDGDDEEGDKGKGEGEGKVVTGSGSFIIKPPSFKGIRRSSRRYVFFENLSPILESHDEE
ncbi:hypothetical protein GGR55DRAFT_678862 [Xylaria sp. FL0064]|nr:hypothetical protein GGR55DRAFT_678862 [Xylaria sp. FL0064]